MAFSTDRFGAAGVQLTGDELRFQRFSAPTHPTGYVWEEKQVKCKIKIIRKKRPYDTCKAVYLITVHSHKKTSITTCL